MKDKIAIIADNSVEYIEVILDAWNNDDVVILIDVRQNMQEIEKILRENQCNRIVTDAEMISACKQANIYEYIQSLPNGLDTVVGEGGSKMSGGQKQRLVLARMIIYRPDIILLDEATSALDIKNTEEFIKSVKNNFKDKIVLIVTHDYTVARECDYVFFMESGKIKNSGKHEELIKDERYMNMWGKEIAI